MTVNPFFEFQDVTSEQDLWDDLTVESIQMFGEDVLYIPRHLVNFDKLLGSDDSSRFETAYTIEMRTKNVLGFSGDKEFYSQFGHQIRDELVLTVSRRRWMTEVGSLEDKTTPDEGDLIWHNRYHKLFVIKYVDPRESFYSLGKLYTWELTCEVFEYSGEDIDTGVNDVDVFEQISPNDYHWALTDENGNVLTDENDNILVVDQYDLDAIDPGTVTEYVPDELKTVANYNIKPVDPFDFTQSQ